MASVKHLANLTTFNDVQGDLTLTGDLIVNGLLFQFPTSLGLSGQVLTTNGVGQAQWGTVSSSTLNDFNISAPSNGQALIYNSTSHKWVNTTLTGASVGLGNVANLSPSQLFTAPTITGPVVINGDLTVNGSQTTTGPSVTTSPTLTLNNGEAGAGVSAGAAGVIIDRGTLTNYEFEFVEASQTFRIGLIGSTQAVATREDTPSSGAIPAWNASSLMFDTSIGLTASEATQLKNIGVLTISSTQWGYLNALNQSLATSQAVTFASETLQASSNQIVLKPGGSGNTLTLTATNPATSSRTLTIPDPGSGTTPTLLAYSGSTAFTTVSGPYIKDDTTNSILALGFHSATGQSGSRGTWLGVGSGNTTGTGTDNTSTGYNSGNAITSGHDNTLLGSTAGLLLQTGIANTFVGSGAGSTATNTNYAIAIGYGAINTTTLTAIVGGQTIGSGAITDLSSGVIDTCSLGSAFPFKSVNLGASNQVSFTSKRLTTIVVNAGGSGYQVGDVLGITNTGAVVTNNVQLTVATAPGGIIGSLSITSPGDYVVLPSTLTGNALTGGHGTGATANLTFTQCTEQWVVNVPNRVSTTITIPDPGASTQVILGTSTGGQTITGGLTIDSLNFSSVVPQVINTTDLGSTSLPFKSLFIGTSSTDQVQILTSGSIAASRQYTLQDAGGSATFIMSTTKANPILQTITNGLSINETQYSTGTASQTTTTVTGSGTTWTSAMVGGVIVFSGGQRGTILAASATSLTVDTSQSVSSTSYTIYYGGIHSDATSVLNLAAPTVYMYGTSGINIGLIGGTTTIANSIRAAANGGNVDILYTGSSTGNFTLLNGGGTGSVSICNGTASNTISVGNANSTLGVLGTINLGVTGSAAIGIGSTSYSGTISVGNASSTLGVLGAINMGVSGSGAIAIGNVSTTTTALGVLNLGTTGSAAIGIGSTSYSGTISVGNASSTLGVLGTINLGVTGSASIGIGSSSYSGTISIGNTSSTLGVLGAINMGVTGSGAIAIGNASTTTTALGILNLGTTGSAAIGVGSSSYSGTMSVGNASSTLGVLGTINLGVTGSAAIGIGSSSYSGTMSVGNASSTLGVLGAINLGVTGSAAIGIGSSSYSGTISIGNASTTLTNIVGPLNWETTGNATATFGNASSTFNMSGQFNWAASNTSAGLTFSIGNNSSDTVAKTINIGNHASGSGKSTINLDGNVNFLSTSVTSFASTLVPSTAGGVALGSASLPFSSLYLGNAATNNAQITGTFAGAVTLTVPDPGTSANFIMSTIGANPIVQKITNGLSINETLYTTGTAGTGGVSSATVAGSSTVWTTAMIGGVIIFSSGQRGTILTVPSGTSLTIDAAITVANGTSYTIYYGGIHDDSTGVYNNATATSYNVGILNLNTVSNAATNIGTGTYAGTISMGNASSTLGVLGAINLGVTGSAAIGIGSSSYSGTISLGNASSTLGVLGAINMGVSGSGAIAIGNALTTTTALGIFNLGTTGSAAIGIGSASYSGTISVGNASSTLGVLGIINLGMTGSAAIGIGATSYSGTISMGNASSTLGVLGTVNMGTSGSAAINIGTSSYTGNVIIGNAGIGASSAVFTNSITSSTGNNLSITSAATKSVNIGGNVSININTAGGTTSIVAAGSSQLNLGTGTYTGTIAIGNHAGTLPIVNFDAAVNYLSTSTLSFATPLLPSAAGSVALGSSTLPFSSLWLGTSSSNIVDIVIAAGIASARTYTLPEVGTNASFILNTTSSNAVVQTIASGFSLNETLYTTGTAGTGGVSSTTVTGSGTSWTSAMIGGVIMFSNGTRGTITAVGSGTSLTVDAAITVSAGTSYTIYYAGEHIDSSSTYNMSKATTYLTGSTTVNIQTIGTGTTNIGNTSASLSMAGSTVGIAAANSLSSVINLGSGSSYTGTIHIADGSGASTINIGNHGAPSTMNLDGAINILSTATWSSAAALSITNATVASSKTTGALIVTGGVGISGALYTGHSTLDDASGNMTIGGTTFKLAPSAVIDTSSAGSLTLGSTATSINLLAASTGNINLGNGLNTVYLGSTGAQNSVVNIQVGSGSNGTNIGTGSYAGTLAIGNHSGPSTLNMDGNINILSSSIQLLGDVSSGWHARMSNLGGSFSSYYDFIATLNSEAVTYTSGNDLGIQIGGITVQSGGTAYSNSGTITVTIAGNTANQKAVISYTAVGGIIQSVTFTQGKYDPQGTLPSTFTDPSPPGVAAVFNLFWGATVVSVVPHSGAGGTGYAVGDTFSIGTGATTYVGATSFTIQAIGMVNTVSSGVVTSAVITNHNNYNSQFSPLTNIATTTLTGSGSGLAIDATFGASMPFVVAGNPNTGFSAMRQSFRQTSIYNYSLNNNVGGAWTQQAFLNQQTAQFNTQGSITTCTGYASFGQGYFSGNTTINGTLTTGNIVTSGSSALNIGTGTYSGTLTLGNHSGPSTINLDGTINFLSTATISNASALVLNTPSVATGGLSIALGAAQTLVLDNLSATSGAAANFYPSIIGTGLTYAKTGLSSEGASPWTIISDGTHAAMAAIIQSWGNHQFFCLANQATSTNLSYTNTQMLAAEVMRLTSTGLKVYNGGTAGSTVFNAATTGVVSTVKNTLDDSTGNMTLQGSITSTVLNTSPFTITSQTARSGPAIVANTDTLLKLVGSGYDGSVYQPVSTIVAKVDGTPAAGIVPTRINFLTTDTGGASNQVLNLRADKSVTTIKNTLDDGTGLMSLSNTSSSPSPSITQTQTTSASAAYTKYVNSQSGNACWIGLDGNSAASNMPGISGNAMTLTTNGASIYLAPGQTTTWGLQVATGKVVSTWNSTLDDGSGHATFTDQTGSATPVVINNAAGGATSNNGLVLQVGGVNKAQFKWGTALGCQIFDYVNSADWLVQNGTTKWHVETGSGNILDDGSSNMTVKGGFKCTGALTTSQTATPCTWSGSTQTVTCNGNSGTVSIPAFSCGGTTNATLVINNSNVTSTSVILITPVYSAVVGNLFICIQSQASGTFTVDFINTSASIFTHAMNINFLVC